MEAPHSRRAGWPRAAAPVVLALILVLVFCYTLAARAPWLEAAQLDPLEAIAAADLGFVQACLRRDSLDDCVSLLAQPGDAAVRELAQSLPPVWIPADHPLGRALAPLAAVNALGRAAALKTCATLGHVRVASGAQLMASLCLAWWAFSVIRRAGFSRGSAFLLSFTPGLAMLLLPGILFWSATPLSLISAEVVLFAVIIALEGAYFLHKRPTLVFALLALQAIACALGTLMDPIFLLLTLILFALRLGKGPSCRAFAGIALQALIVAAPAVVLLFVSRRAGLEQDVLARVNLDLWARAIPAGYGEYARALWIVSLTGFAAAALATLARRFRGNRAYGQLLSAMALVVLPVLARSALVVPASHAGESATLFYAFPLAAVPFAFLPAIIGVGLGPWAMIAPLGRFAASVNGREWSVRLPLVPSIALLLGVIWTFSAHRGFQGQFPEPTRYAKLSMQRTQPVFCGLAPLSVRMKSYAQGLRLTDQVALVDYRLQHIAGDRFRFRLLLHVAQPVPGDYTIGASAFVGDEDLPALPWDRAGSTHDAWDFQPDPPTSEWQPGEYVLVETEIAATPVPYTVLLAFYERRFEGAWRKRVHGTSLNLHIANPHCPRQAASLRNPGFEEWAGGRPHPWEIAAGTTVPGMVASVEAREGALAAAVTPTETPVDLVQQVQAYGPIAGRGILFTVKARCANPATAYLGVSFAGREFWGTPHPGDDQWRTILVHCSVPPTFNKQHFDVIIRTVGGPGIPCLIDGATLDVL